jgi:hypothetical protein
MNKRFTAFFWILAFMNGCAPAEIMTPGIDFSGVRPDLAGEPTRVLVLGSPHLSGMTEKISIADLALLKERLEAFAPHIVTIESVSGRTCDAIRRYETLYAGVADNYCFDPSIALATLHLDAPTALAALINALNALPAQPSASDRRRLAALFFATGNPYSSAIQWLKLPVAERINGDGVNEELKNAIEKRIKSRNENMTLGATLALSLGHEQVFPMDDHTADAVYFKTPNELSDVLQLIWGREFPKRDSLRSAAEAYLGSPQGIVAYYLAINSLEYQKMTVDSDIGLAAATPDANLVARQYVAWWQVRGLRMAANVVEIAANHPGARVLVFVGSGHKPYFDAYLNQMFDIEVVDVSSVLEVID